jgi:hypothetical protein
VYAVMLSLALASGCAHDRVDGPNGQLYEHPPISEQPTEPTEWQYVLVPIVAVVVAIVVGVAVNGHPPSLSRANTALDSL